MLRAIALGILSLACATVVQAQAPAQPPAPPVQVAKVKVESGVLSGTETERARIFRNIPYAAPPVGALRWAPPKAPLAWSGERDASTNGVSCPQKMNADGTPNGGSANGPMSEDCLQLNVFAPKAAKGAPVMVWIHGGSHTEGAGWVYDGQNFARDGVILVAINYRLGPLGYFAHPDLTKAAAKSAPLGDYGLMDQIAALQWVQRNIAAFGGDPKNVTVFGESAGGMSTLAILATPSAKGLFQKAVVQSGGGWTEPSTLAQKEAEGAALAAKAGAASLADLRAVPADKLIAESSGQYGPFVDGRLMKETPSQAFAGGRAIDVPLIIGANSGEASLLGRNPLPNASALIARMPPGMKTAYGVETGKDDQAVIREAFGDRAMVGPARWIAGEAAGGQPAWLYHFSYVGARFRPMGMTTAAHAAEIQYVFEYWGRRTPLSMVADDDKAMATLMHGCWVAFAKTGAPKCAVDWPVYDPARDQLVEFGADSGVRTGFRKAQLDAQQALVVPSLALPSN